jgi:Arc/MetJ-type ribon-helix-helix transcriptional regulator
MREQYKTISIPEPLFSQIEALVKETGFRNPTEYILFVLRRSLAEIEKEKERLTTALTNKAAQEEVKKIKARLKRLGYLV